jgi:hypothetical protein
MQSIGRGTAIQAIFLAALLAAASPALAACPIELATYADTRGVAELEFTPGKGGATVSNSFRLLLGKDVVLDGIVQWTRGFERPYGWLSRGCPEGDVTGADLEACTLWAGVIYTSDETGSIGLLPAQGEDAPKTLILADLGPSLNVAKVVGSAAGVPVPDDVFALMGCQE